jgi:hypothetical protein
MHVFEVVLLVVVFVVVSIATSMSRRKIGPFRRFRRNPDD